MKKALLFVLACLLAAGMTVTADAAMHGKGKGTTKGMGKGPDRGMTACCMGDGHPMMMKLAALGLDDKQQEAAKAIHYKVKKESIRKHADQEIAEIELKELLSHDPVDIKAAEAKLRQIESLRTDLHLAHIKAREEIKTILTPDQKKKFRSMMGMMHGDCMGMQGDCGMMGGMGMMHGCGMGGMQGGRGHGMGDGMGMGMDKGMMNCGCGMMMGGMGQVDDGTGPAPEKKEGAAPPSAGHQH